MDRTHCSNRTIIRALLFLLVKPLSGMGILPEKECAQKHEVQCIFALELLYSYSANPFSTSAVCTQLESLKESMIPFINVTDNRKRMFAHWAAERGNWEMLKFLSTCKRYCFTVKDVRDQTPLDIAYQRLFNTPKDAADSEKKHNKTLLQAP